MAKISGINALKKAGSFQSGGNGGGFFSLKDDLDTAVVRFLYTEEDGSDIDYFIVHQVEIGDKKRWVSCGAVQDDGSIVVDDCPLCKAGIKRQEKLFLQLYDVESKTVKIWERGAKFAPRIVSLVNRYKNLSSQEFEIERNGKKGSTSTEYQMFPLPVDNVSIDDLVDAQGDKVEVQELLGSFILDLSMEEAQQVVDGTYTLPERGGNSSSRKSTQAAKPAPRQQRTRSSRGTEAF